MKPNRRKGRLGALLAACLALASCSDQQTGPIRVVAIGGEPQVINPNLQPVSPASALLLATVAQGLVRFDAAAEIEPALAQSWIVSDDGLSYTFRLRRTPGANGETVTAKQVVERLQAAGSRSSRNPLKPVLGVIDQIEAMTDSVLEIRLRSPRPNFLQLLAQPELAILLNNQGTGPYQLAGQEEGAVRVAPPPPEEDAAAAEAVGPEILIRAASAAVAIATFAAGRAELVTGGTMADLPLLAVANIPADRAAFDPTRGLFGLMFTRTDGETAEPRFRQALSMAIDRDAIQARFGTPTFQPRASLLPPGLTELGTPAFPDWSTAPLPTRRQSAARIVAEYADVERPRLRVAMPPGLGYRILFAHLQRDWRLIGVDAEAVELGEQADLRLIDEVAPANLVSWYLRHFMCGASAVCDERADELLEVVRTTVDPAMRQELLAEADRTLVAAAPFISLGQPIRWSLRSERLNNFRTNAYARHPPTELID